MIGKVILAAAGPGDPDLITVKALRWLRRADVVLVDRLVSRELVELNVKEGAQVIAVGKHGGYPSTSQDEINDLLVHHAKQQEIVLRLKGGDVSFFSNVLDELRTLVSHGIPYEIVPGVTAASGAAAYAGIPLTARGYSTGVRFLTISSSEFTDWGPDVWNDLSTTTDTLVFYMSGKGVDIVTSRLLDSGSPASRWVVIVEQATTPYQKVFARPLADFAEQTYRPGFQSPSILIIGDVGSLHDVFKWNENYRGEENFFAKQKALTHVISVC